MGHMAEEKNLEEILAEITKVKQLLMEAEFYFSKKRQDVLFDAKIQELFWQWTQWMEEYKNRKPGTIEEGEKSLQNIRGILGRVKERMKKFEITANEIKNDDLRAYYAADETEIKSEVNKPRFENRNLF